MKQKEVKLYGIKNCGTVKKALNYLKEQGLEPILHDYRVDGEVSKTKISAWEQTLGFKKLRNTSGGSYRAIGDEKKTWESEEWVEAYAKDMMLIKRPVLEIDGEPKAVGFRIAEYEELLD